MKREQYGFVASNVFSVAEAWVTADNGGHAFPFAIYNDKRPVGFLMLGYGENADRDGVSVVPKGTKRILVTGTPLAVPNWKLHNIIETSGAAVRRNTAGSPTSRKT